MWKDRAKCRQIKTNSIEVKTYKTGEREREREREREMQRLLESGK